MFQPEAGVAARLTREGDEPVSLTDRTAVANRLQASAFVSIHANASLARGAHGAETYFMSADASDSQAAQAAARENASAPADTVQLILLDQAQDAPGTHSEGGKSRPGEKTEGG
jgi:N-acetylmuramoyl-L-alanine amidase